MTEAADIDDRSMGDGASFAGTGNWSAVYSLALGVIGFVSAELLPVSLLTPIAADLGVSDGVAGQAVATTAIVAMFSSLLIASVIRSIDRRYVLLLFTASLVASNLLAAFAVNYAMLLTGRLVLGLGLGGFWSMSAAVSMRLVPASHVPKALSIVYGGVSIAVIAAAPVGSYFGGLIGWRGVFLANALLCAIALVWQFSILPSIVPARRSRLRTIFELLRRSQIRSGILAMTFVFAGHFAFITYVRPFLEERMAVGTEAVSLAFLGFGLANIAGTFAAGFLIARSLRGTLLAMPLLMGVIAISLAFAGSSYATAVVAIVVWGFAFGAVPVTWTVWQTRAVPEEVESFGGLRVAAIQLAITTGAASGGILFDWKGATGAFIGSGVMLLLASALLFAFVRVGSDKQPHLKPYTSKEEGP
jgi:predicted MFS family arabinose efflux permease